MMHMTFYWGLKVTLLLDSWKTEGWLDYCLTLCACFLFSAFYQYMESLRLRFKFRSSSNSNNNSSTITTTTTTPLLHNPKLAAGSFCSPARLGVAVLFGVNSAIGYLLMLAVMSFNAGVFIAIVLGLSLGYLVFRSVDEDIIVVDNPCACA
ncbi:hypothetical protein NMG60_11025733 [Bertholletia excelsa]